MQHFLWFTYNIVIISIIMINTFTIYRGAFFSVSPNPTIQKNSFISQLQGRVVLPFFEWVILLANYSSCYCYVAPAIILVMHMHAV